jgi:hypothetical protein
MAPKMETRLIWISATTQTSSGQARILELLGQSEVVCEAASPESLAEFPLLA